MTSNHDRKTEIRARMARTGEPYNVARRAIENETVTEPAGVTVEAGVPAEELGVGALPTGATPARRAHAEAVWRATGDPDTPCRCSGRGGNRIRQKGAAAGCRCWSRPVCGECGVCG